MVLRRERRRLYQRYLYSRTYLLGFALASLIWFAEASTLDTWVFDRLKTLFQNATLDPSLDLQLRQEKSVFFLHLLGLDVTGHSHRPHSRVSTSNAYHFTSTQLPELTLRFSAG